MEWAMRMVVGLGNPGREYEHTRHNAGFMLVDALHRDQGGTSWQKKFKGEWSEVRSSALGDDGRVVLLKPQTFMNLSGESVQPAADFFKVAPGAIIVCHDELDLPLGTVRVKVGGGHGGHNGLRSLHQHLGPDYVRIRLGIGKPGGKGEHVVGHVLGGFSRSEKDAQNQLLEHGLQALLAVLKDGPQKAMNSVNARA